LSPTKCIYLSNVQARSPRLARPVSIIPSIPRTFVLGENPKNRRQLVPDAALTHVQSAVSSDLERAMAEAADKSPDNIERMVSVDPTSIFNALLRAFSASFNDCSENVAVSVSSGSELDSHSLKP